MADLDDAQLTREVIESFASVPNARTRELIAKLVTHVHALVRDTELTFDEWLHVIDFLTRAGYMSGATRQELILLSDVLGVSMLVDALGHRRETGATQTTVLGPFYVGEQRPMPHGSDLAVGLRGDPLAVHVVVHEIGGAPIAGATLDVWQADADGLYDVQKPDYTPDKPSLRARFTSDADGRCWFRTIVPQSYPVPTDGPVGELLRATRRSPMRPGHIHFLIAAPGKQRLITHLFIAGDPYLESDAVFGVKSSLIATVTSDANGKRLDYGFALDGLS